MWKDAVIFIFFTLRVTVLSVIVFFIELFLFLIQSLWEMKPLILMAYSPSYYYLLMIKCFFSGIPCFYAHHEVEMNAERICKASHAAPVARAACVFIALLVASLLQVCSRSVSYTVGT